MLGVSAGVSLRNHRYAFRPSRGHRRSPALAALNVPFTMTLRGNEPKHSRSPLGRFWMCWALRRASGSLPSPTGCGNSAIELGAEPEKLRVIPNGIDASVFFRPRPGGCRAKHGFAPDRPLIVSAGALVERKGHHRIIQALAAMARGRSPQLAIAGGAAPKASTKTDPPACLLRLRLQTRRPTLWGHSSRAHWRK